MLCDICRVHQAFYRRRFEGVRLCKTCFKKSFENKVRRTILEHRMLSRDDHLGVAVSGGKDSLTLLYILKKIGARFPDFRLSILTVDEGIEGYREESLNIAHAYCKSIGIPIKVFSFKETFGSTLDEIVEEKKESHPCSLCGVMRRRMMDIGARRMNVDKLATAHNLDDELQTFFLNIFHGEPGRIGRNKPFLDGSNGTFVVRIKPFHRVLEREISLYAFLSGIPFQESPCPYANTSLRNDVRRFLDEMENRHPGAKYMAYNAINKLRALPTTVKKKSFTNCVLCGSPSSNQICSVCKIID